MLSIQTPGIASVADAQIQITIADLAVYEPAVTQWRVRGEVCPQSGDLGGGTDVRGTDLRGTGMSVRNRVSSSKFAHFGTKAEKARKSRTGYPAPSGTG